MRYKEFKGFRHGLGIVTFVFNREHFKKAGMPDCWGGMPILEAHTLINQMNREQCGEWTYWLEEGI